MDISIVVINYKTPELTKNCIQSVEQVFSGTKISHEIILVDNCSKDGRFQELETLETDNVHVFETPKNGGFGYGNNYGVKRAQGEFLFFLNSDTILYPNVIIEMLDYLKANQDCGAISCYMEDGERKPLVISHIFENTKTLFLQTVVKPMTPGFIKKRRAERYQHKEAKEVFNCDWISGAAMLIPRKVFEQVGGWNEIFFMYMEDEELCYRIHKAGYRVAVYPKLGLQHLVGKSGGSAFAAYERYRSKILYYRLTSKKHKILQRKLLLIQAKQYIKALPKEQKKEVLLRLKGV